MKVADNIQLARTKLSMTQEDLAENIGVTRQAISRWENGQTQPSSSNMVKIAAMLHVSVEQLIGTEPMASASSTVSSVSGFTDDLIESWFDLFYRTIGVDLSRYAMEHIRKTVSAYMQRHELHSVSAFIRLMNTSQTRRLEFLHAVQPPAPVFFDNPDFYKYLRELLPHIHADGSPIRVWALSSANGQEAYSLAMTIAEFQEQQHCQDNVRIFATDTTYLDDRHQIVDGIFSAQDVQSIPPALREKYLLAVDGGFQMCAQIRKMIVFSPYDPLHDPPFSQIDIICCRRLFSFLASASRERLIQTAYHSLTSSGCLLLPAEYVLPSGQIQFSPDRNFPFILHKQGNSEEIWDYENSRQITSIRPDLFSHGTPIQRILQQFFVIHYDNAILMDENFGIIYVGDDILHRFHLDRQGYSIRLADHIDSDLMQRIQLFAHRLQTATDPKRSNQTLTYLPQIGQTVYMRVSGCLVEKHWYYLVVFYDCNPKIARPDESQPMLEQQLSDTESNLRSKLQELVLAQDQIEVLKEKISSLTHALTNRNWEVCSLRHELELLEQEINRAQKFDSDAGFPM